MLRRRRPVGLIGVMTKRLGELGHRRSEVGTWRASSAGACFVAHVCVTRSAQGLAPGTIRDEGSGTHGVRPGRRRWCSTRRCRRRWRPAGSRWPTSSCTRHRHGWRWVPCCCSVSACGRSRRAGRRRHPRRRRPGGRCPGGTAITITATSVGWGLAAGLSYASYYLLGRRLFQRLGGPLTYALCLSIGAVILALVVRPHAPQAEAWPWLIALGVVSTYLPYLALAAGITRVPASRAVVVATTEPLLAAVLGAAFYDERLGPVGLVGGALILVSATTVASRR